MPITSVDHPRSSAETVKVSFPFQSLCGRYVMPPNASLAVLRPATKEATPSNETSPAHGFMSPETNRRPAAGDRVRVPWSQPSVTRRKEPGSSSISTSVFRVIRRGRRRHRGRTCLVLKLFASGLRRSVSTACLSRKGSTKRIEQGCFPLACRLNAILCFNWYERLASSHHAFVGLDSISGAIRIARNPSYLYRYVIHDTSISMFSATQCTRFVCSCLK